MRKLSRDMKVSPRTIKRAVYTNLKLRSYVRTPKQLLTDAMKATKQERAKKVLHYLKRHGPTVKIFTVDAVLNRRNDRYITHSPSGVKGIFRTKHQPKSWFIYSNLVKKRELKFIIRSCGTKFCLG